MTMLAPHPQDIAVTLPPDPPPPTTVTDFIAPDEWARLLAEQADLHARALALVPLVLDAVAADQLIARRLSEIAHRAAVLFADEIDPQAEALTALLRAVGSNRTCDVLCAVESAINPAGPGSFAALAAFVNDAPKEYIP